MAKGMIGEKRKKRREEKGDGEDPSDQRGPARGKMQGACPSTKCGFESV